MRWQTKFNCFTSINIKARKPDSEQRIQLSTLARWGWALLANNTYPRTQWNLQIMHLWYTIKISTPSGSSPFSVISCLRRRRSLFSKKSRPYLKAKNQSSRVCKMFRRNSKTPPQNQFRSPKRNFKTRRNHLEDPSRRSKEESSWRHCSTRLNNTIHITGATQ